MLPARRKHARHILSTSLALLLILPWFVAPTARGQELNAAVNVTSLGFRVNEGGNGDLSLGWTGGNLGNLWIEGQWVPYQLVLDNVQSVYPNLDGLPDIVVSYDFTKSGARFVDLVRGVQAGQQVLTDSQAWPDDAGQPHPMGTKAQIQDAQNDVGNTAPYENVWQLGGNGNFALLNLPQSQVNRAIDGSIGTPTTDRRTITITRANLLAAGIPPTADTIVIYYQLHESRSFVWNNALQAALANPPTDAWGGYLYAAPPFSTDSRPGSSQVPGSSGHVHLESLSGSQDVPIPIPAGLPGAVSGLKWQDDNGNAQLDGGESTLSGWRIHVSGMVDNILFSASTLTDDDGNYSFPNLTNGTWTLSEAEQREVPAAAGFNQTYPNAATAPVGVATRTAVNTAGRGAWGWSATLTAATASQGNLDFGNRACIDAGTSDPVDQAVCPGGTAVFSATASGTGPFTFTWRKGVTVLSDGGDIDITTVGGTSTLSIANVEAADAGTYSVSVTGECGPGVEESALLSLSESVATTDPDDQELCPGGTAAFSTTASGTGPFTFVWRKGATVLSTGGDITISTVGANSSLSIANVEAADAGSYSVTVDGVCGPDAVQAASLSLDDAVAATDLDDLVLCPGGTAVFTTTASGSGPYTFVWRKGAVVLSTGGRLTIETAGDVSTLTITDVEAGDAGTYSVTVGGGCGEDVVRDATLGLSVDAGATTLVDQELCQGGTAEFSTTASGTGPYTFVWKKGAAILSTGGDITITTVGATSSLSIANVEPGDAGGYSVTVSGACGDPVVRSAALRVLGNVGATGLASRTFCTGTEVVLSATASGAGPYVFVWKKDGNVLASGGTLTITTVGNVSTLAIDPATAADDGPYSVTVSGSCGPDVTLNADITISDCDEFCSLTQGFYGNPGGTQCFQGRTLGTLALLQELITPQHPLVVGKAGRSLTVTDGSEECVIKRLPGGGPAEALPATFGDVSMSPPSCSVPAQVLKNGRFHNILLAQTITLDLNLRFDPTLGSFRLCTTFVTQKASKGPDQCLGTPDDVPDPGPTDDAADDPIAEFQISVNVIDALVAANLPRTPVGILELANRALAGQATHGASASELAGAADAINRGFDECRFLLSCVNDGSAGAQRIGAGNWTDVDDGADRDGTGRRPTQFELLANQPNPFRGTTAIRFALPERSRVMISIFDVAGREVAKVADAEFDAGIRAVDWDAGSERAIGSSGLYFYRLSGIGLETGARFNRTGKMMILR